MSNTINSVNYDPSPQSKHAYVAGDGKGKGVYYDTGMFGWIKSIFGRSVAVKNDEGKKVYIDLKSLKNRFANKENQVLTEEVIKIANAVLVVRPNTIKDINYNEEALRGFFGEVFKKFKDSDSENFSDWIGQKNNSGYKNALDKIAKEGDYNNLKPVILSEDLEKKLSADFIKSFNIIEYMITSYKNQEIQNLWNQLNHNLELRRDNEIDNSINYLRYSVTVFTVEILLEKIVEIFNKSKEVFIIQDVQNQAFNSMLEALEKKKKEGFYIESDLNKEIEMFKFIKKSFEEICESRIVTNNYSEESVNKDNYLEIAEDMKKLQTLIEYIQENIDKKNSTRMEEKPLSLQDEEDQISLFSEASFSSQNTITTTATTSTTSSSAIEEEGASSSSSSSDPNNISDERTTTTSSSTTLTNSSSSNLPPLIDAILYVTKDVTLADLVNILFNKFIGISINIVNKNESLLKIELDKSYYLFVRFEGLGEAIIQIGPNIDLKLEKNTIIINQGFYLKEPFVVDLVEIKVEGDDVLFKGQKGKGFFSFSQEIKLEKDGILQSFIDAYQINEKDSKNLKMARAAKPI